jgi:hypothetical protein
MAYFTRRREVYRDMIWICRLVVFIFMAPKACFGCVGIIPQVAACTIVCNGNMCPCKNIVIIVYRECCRFPARVGGMARFALRRNINNTVIWIGCLIKSLCMAAVTNSGCADIAIGMAFNAIGGGMCPG